MDEYISKQRAKDLMGCCLASAKANYKAETSVFKREQFKHYAETIEAMIDVVGSVEAADVQPVVHGYWEECRRRGTLTRLRKNCYQVSCTNPMCFSVEAVCAYTEEQAIIAWNRRRENENSNADNTR